MYFLKITGDGFQNVERITIR